MSSLDRLAWIAPPSSCAAPSFSTRSRAARPALLMIAGAGLVEGLLGLPAALLRGAGLVLMPYVAFVIYTGTRETISRPAVWAIIVANVLWAAASALLLVSGWVAPTALGIAFVIAQAVVVALLGELQYMGLRQGAERADGDRLTQPFQRCGMARARGACPGPWFWVKRRPEYADDGA